MKVLGLSGSPRRKGNTSLLLEHLILGASNRGAEVEIINLVDLHIGGCMHCDSCFESGFCIFKDDMSIVYQALEGADVIVLASPLHFMTVTAHMKLAMDRCQVYWARKYVIGSPPLGDDKKRRGIFISTGGQKGSIFDAARVCVKALFTSLDIGYHDELLFSDIDENGAILRHPGALAAASRMGSRLVEIQG